MIRCCICDVPVGAEQQKRFTVVLEGSRLAACSAECQRLARENPLGCNVCSDTALELIPI